MSNPNMTTIWIKKRSRKQLLELQYDMRVPAVSIVVERLIQLAYRDRADREERLYNLMLDGIRGE